MCTTWVKPSLVAEVKFTEWTTKGEMRHPVYLGLRADKRAEDVAREREKTREVTKALAFLWLRRTF
jgi:bifunctional non-homologous end joining protein LigD